MRIRSYRDLEVWQLSMDLAVAVYDCTDLFPRYEQYGLTAQIRRAVVSIPSNIAEGQGRAQPGEFLNSLSVARGSLQELETQLMIAQRRRYLTAAQLESLLETTDHVSRMLTSLRNSISP